jgi:hypothetical protein
MELHGLNTSAGCKDNTSKLKMASFQQRRANFFKMCNSLKTEFNKSCVINGVINRKKAVNFFKNLYKRTAPPNIFVNEKGISLQTVPQIVCAFNLMDKDNKELYSLLLLALSSPEIPSITARRVSIGESVVQQDKENDFYKDNLLEGGAPSLQDTQKAENIIKYSIDMIGKQGFIPPNIVNQYSEDLNTVAASYNPKEEEKKLALSSKMVTTMGSSGMGSSGMGSNMRGMVGGPSSSSNFLGNFFSNLGRQGSSSASGTGSGIGNDSCGNNTSIVCSGDDLVVTVTLKLNELIASCMSPETIQHLGNHPGNHPGNNPGNLITDGGEGDDDDDTDDNDSNDSKVVASAAPPPPQSLPQVPQSPPPPQSLPQVTQSPPPPQSPSIVSSAAPSSVAIGSSSSAAPSGALNPDASAAPDLSSSMSESESPSTSPEKGTAPTAKVTGAVLPGLSSVPPEVAEGKPAADDAAAAIVTKDAADATLGENIDTTKKKEREVARAALGGKSTKNKSKKNKKSNKNKTKKRKNYNSRKIKFTKVKTL